jgi:hypothetical protein
MPENAKIRYAKILYNPYQPILSSNPIRNADDPLVLNDRNAGVSQRFWRDVGNGVDEPLSIGFYNSHNGYNTKN